MDETRSRPREYQYTEGKDAARKFEGLVKSIIAQIWTPDSEPEPGARRIAPDIEHWQVLPIIRRLFASPPASHTRTPVRRPNICRAPARSACPGPQTAPTPTQPPASCPRRHQATPTRHTPPRPRPPGNSTGHQKAPPQRAHPSEGKGGSGCLPLSARLSSRRWGRRSAGNPRPPQRKSRSGPTLSTLRLDTTAPAAILTPSQAVATVSNKAFVSPAPASSPVAA